MIVEFRHLTPEDCLNIETRKETRGFNVEMTRAAAERLASLPNQYAAVTEHGRILGVGGIIELWPGRGECWAVFAPGVRKYMSALTEFSQEVLDESPINRLEVAVRCDFPEGHEWAHELGFKAEAECLEAYDAEGNDCSLYARVKNVKPKKENMNGNP